MIYIIMTIAGACLYRWRGHASKYKKFFPRPLNQIAFAMPYAVVTFMFLLQYVGPVWEPYPYWIWAATAAVLILSTLGTLTGHGKFMDLASYKILTSDETLEFTIKWLENKIPNYWYDALGLAVTGLAVTLPAGIVLMNPLLALSGALKAPAYMLAKLAKTGTAGGEWLTGAFLWGSLAILVL